MDNPFVVGCGQTMGNLYRDFNRLPGGYDSALQALAQGLSFQHFGHHVRSSVVGSDVMHGQNVGVAESGHRPRFSFEAVQAISVGRE